MTSQSAILAFCAIGLVACATGDGGDPEVCEAAAAHVESCIPGYVAASRAETCDADATERARELEAMSCAQIIAQVSDGKADSQPALRGIRVRREGNRTYFLIPLSQTWGTDRARLLDETIKKFTSRMAQLNQELIAKGVDLSALLTGAPAQEFANNYIGTLQNLLGSDLDKRFEVELGTSYGAPRELSLWNRYVLPQAFFAYFSAKFTVNWGVGGGASATAIIVIQPWLSVAVDHTLAQPTVVGKSYELDVAVIGAPSVEIGAGLGGGLPLRIGLGAVFGPINRASDLTGTGIGISASSSVPIVGGVHAKFLTVLKSPPLFMVFVGYSGGTSAEVEIHGTLKQLLDLNAFLAWINTLGQG